MTRLKSLISKAFAVSSIALSAVSMAEAAELPPIKVTPSNEVMACATPGRLMAYLKANNSKIDEKFESLATEYMRAGEELGVRWDYAFFQMLVETGYLKFTGDVSVSQNNFAGLGATGKGAKGETFPDVATGARAHLQHVLMYTGTPVENPVAQRTRDVQAWGVLTKWQQTIKDPMTFKDLASKWAPTSRGYPRDIANVADRFASGICKDEDPRPELVAEARGGKAADVAASPTPEAEAEPEVAKPKAEPAVVKPKTAAADKSTASPDATKPNSVKVLNSAPAEETSAAAPTDKSLKKTATNFEENLKNDSTVSDKDNKTFETASVAAGAAKAKVADTSKGKCKVWQASYGGSKAVIIKATAEAMTNYTVLDVNEGSEKREADAYIAAYAKGGATVAEFTNPTQALEKAFELCPEG